MSHTCSICNKEFTRASNLTEHSKLQHKPSVVNGSSDGFPRKKCSVKSCSSVFRQASNFVVHFKEKHLQTCRCTNELCKKCENKLSVAKTKWRNMTPVPNHHSNCLPQSLVSVW